MILGFSSVFPNGVLKGKRTHFVEKIHVSLKYNNEHSISSIYKNWFEEKQILKGYNFNFKVGVDCKPKRHTIRVDEKRRWKPGMKIHFYINVRRKRMFNFAPILHVKSVQKIEIVRVANVFTPYTIQCNNKTYQILIEGQCLKYETIVQLIYNDGFDTVKDFFEWFDKDFSGVLIHWTDLKY